MKKFRLVLGILTILLTFDGSIATFYVASLFYDEDGNSFRDSWRLVQQFKEYPPKKYKGYTLQRVDKLTNNQYIGYYI